MESQRISWATFYLAKKYYDNKYMSQSRMHNKDIAVRPCQETIDFV